MRRSTVLLLLLLSVARTNAAFTTHSTSKGTRPSPSKSICWASKAPSSSRGTSKASEIMNVLKTRYDDDKLQTNSTWSKTKNYVYQASDRLTLQQVNDVLGFLDQLFSPLLVRSILTTCPRILRKDVNTQIKPTIQFLQDLYGDELFSEAISRNPHLLLSSGVGHGDVNPEMDDYLLNIIGLTMRKIATLRKTAPFLFRLATSKVQQVIQFLDDILERGDYDQKQRRDILGKIICTRPSLMNLSVERNLQPRIAFLMERCKLQERDAATLVKSSCGNVLNLSVDDNLCPTLDFLGKLLGQEEESNGTTDDDTVVEVLRKCVLRHPQLLSLSLTNLQAKVDFFEAIDGLSDDSPSSRSASLASRVAIRAPAVYSLSLKNNIVPTVEFLAKAWGTVSPEIEWQGDTLAVNQQQPDKTSEEQEDSLSSLLKEYPSILTMSLEGNIQPTLTFFNRTGYVRLDEEWRLLRDDKSSARPIRGRYIAASLFNRLLPRWHHLIANGWSVAGQEGEGRPDPSTLPPLHLLVGATDRAFCEAFSYSYEDYVAFKDKSVPRLKFSSQFDTWLKTGRPIDVQ